MSVPTLITEMMFNSPTWTDISAYVRAATVKRGSSRVDSPTLRYEAGTATLKLDNRDRRFDPTNLFGPYVTGAGIGDTGIRKFASTVTQVFGIGLTLDIKSVSSILPTSIVNVVSKASGTTGSWTIGKPPGTLSGHKMIIIHISDIGTLANMGTPTGGASWGTVFASRTVGDDALQCKVWIKTAGGAEPSTYTLTQNSGSDGMAVVITLRDFDAVATPIIGWSDNPESTLFTTPATTPAGSNDLELRFVGGSTYGEGGNTWSSNPADGFTEYADKQSGIFTTGALFGKSLTTGYGEGSSTRVLPMRPVRMRATWNFIATTNLIQNPGLEIDTTGWADANGHGTIKRSTDVAYVGGGCLELSRFDQSPGTFVYGVVAQGVALTTAIGNVVTISAYVYVPAASFGKITSYSISATGIANSIVTGPVSADGWYRITRTATLTAQLDNVQITFTTDDTHGDGQVIAYVDAVQAEVRASASPYCDGDQPACSWSGTAHNSSSSRPSTFTFPIFRGFVDQWDITWLADVDSEVTLPCTDGFKILGSHGRLAGALVGTGELTGARISRILDSAGWPVGERSIAAGGSTMQGTTLDGDALTELFLVSDSEIGEFYMDASGLATFRGRASLLSDTRSLNPQARFGDGGSTAGEIPYHDVVISYDDVQLYNDAHVGRTGGVQQVAQDATSIAEYLTHTFERTDLTLQSDAEALSYAQWIIYISKDPELRFDQLVIRPQKQEDDLFPQILAREIGDRIKITRRPPDNTKPNNSGDPVVREVFVRGMELTIEQYFWEMTYNLQSATRVGSFLTLDHPTLGKIGQNALRF